MAAIGPSKQNELPPDLQAKYPLLGLLYATKALTEYLFALIQKLCKVGGSGLRL